MSLGRVQAFEMRYDPLSLVMRGLIQLYRWVLSPLIGPACRHGPSCSEYAIEAIDRHGPWRGGWLALSRLSRCHPWGSHGFDPVPVALEPEPWYAPWRYGRWKIDSDADQENLRETK